MSRRGGPLFSIRFTRSGRNSVSWGLPRRPVVVIDSGDDPESSRGDAAVKLLIIRHAIAEDKDEWAKTGKSDDLRPLTADGHRKMVRVARGLRRVIGSIDLLAASPLVRAQQTAAIVAAEYGKLPIETTAVLVPETDLGEFVDWAEAHDEHEVVAVVGHEPHLGVLATWLLTGGDESRIELKKGAACLLEFEERPTKGDGHLLWSLTPSHLRELAPA
jgi:phosphohistidine phosphatase